jgi:hypothetical protein
VDIDHEAAMRFLLDSGKFKPKSATAVAMLRDRDVFFHVCDYGRVHTNLTNLKSGLRQFLSFEGRPLVNLDVRNSQPLLFSLLLRDHYAGRVMPPDVPRYIELCEQGRFYDVLMKQQGIPAEQRSQFKDAFFGTIFYSENTPVRPAAWQFGQSFPGVYRAAWEMKERDYSELPKRLQRAESALMIGGVATRCTVELPETFIATIHDSILTTEDAAEAVRSIMVEEFNRLGLTPTIQIEHLASKVKTAA